MIPLNVAGSLDTDLSKLSVNDIMTWSLLNTVTEGVECGYAVRHGSRPVKDFARIRGTRDEAILAQTIVPNYFEKAFPCLFPWGRGGIESVREEPVNFNDHVKWALQYFDRRFRCHETFSFVAFAISQRRDALFSAKIQMQCSDFERNAQLMSSITIEDLQRAREQEEHNAPITHPGILLLKKHMFKVCSRVKGSDSSRIQLRSQIWSTNLRMGPPSLWIMINPSDMHDPIAQVLAGESIDLDRFIADSGPDKDQQRRNIAQDPYAAAKFFRFIIEMMMETIFQCKVTQNQCKSEMGALG